MAKDDDKVEKSIRFMRNDTDLTNLMIGGRKSFMTVWRSFYRNTDESVDREWNFEYWTKMSNRINMIVDGKKYKPGKILDSRLDWIYHASRPSSDRPAMIMFDSFRTAMVDSLLNENLYPDWMQTNDTVGNWVYAAGPESSEDGNFSLYGHIAEHKVKQYNAVIEYPSHLDYIGESTASYMFITKDRTITDDLIRLFSENQGIRLSPAMPSSWRPYFPYPVVENTDDWVRLSGESRGLLAVDAKLEFTFSDKILEVKNWKIVSNNTPFGNTYCAVALNQRGNIDNIAKTTTFGQTVESLIGSHADGLDEKTRKMKVKDDIVIRI